MPKLFFEKGEESQSWKDSKEWGKTFFGHWSILSGGTITLLIPFVQSLNKNIIYQNLLILVEVLLVISLITSALSIWLASRISFYNAFPPENKSEKFRRDCFVYCQRTFSPLSILSYLIGIILLIFFINSNIF